MAFREALNVIQFRWFRPYFIGFLLLTAIEVLIARFAHGFVRNFVGDLLVVILLYCLIQSFFDAPKKATILSIFCCAVTVELAQFLQIPAYLGIQKHSTLSILSGATFDWLDVVAYACGCILILIALHTNKSTKRT